MSRITETFFVYINGKTIKVTNEGIKKFEDQDIDALPAMKSYIAQEMAKGKTEGWTPYGNFESSITWEIDLCINKIKNMKQLREMIKDVPDDAKVFIEVFDKNAPAEEDLYQFSCDADYTDSEGNINEVRLCLLKHDKDNG